MKQHITAITAAIGLLAANAPADKPMNPTLQQLDLDGDMVLYLDTSTVEQRILDFVGNMAEITVSSMPASAPSQKQTAENFERLNKLVEWSGLLSVASFGTSTKPVDGTLNRVISVTESTDIQKPLWRILASEPTELQGISYVPANAVYTANSTASLTEVWNFLIEFVTTFTEPQQAAKFQQNIAMAEMMIGTNVTAITGSLENEILLSIQMDEARTASIQPGMMIPEPSLLIGLRTKNPMLSRIILEKLTLAQMPVQQSEQNGQVMHTLNLPMPSPVPVQLTLAQTDDYLLLGSTRDVVASALASRAGRNGLTSTDLFKKLLADAPAQTSAIEFLSPRFMKTYVDIMKQAMSASKVSPEGEAMIDKMLNNYKNVYSGGYALKTPTGIYSKSYVDFGGARPAEMLASSYVGMLSAIAIPSFQKARVNAQRKQCKNNIRIINAAKEQWALESGKTDGDPVTEADISGYIKGGYSALHCPMGGTYTIGPMGAGCTCSRHGGVR